MFMKSPEGLYARHEALDGAVAGKLPDFENC